MKTTVTIRKGRLGILQEKADAINVKATKLGCSLVTLVVGECRLEPDHDRDPAGDLGTMREIVDVTIEGETPRLAGWAFRAALDHLYGDDAGTIIRALPGVEIPERYRMVTGHCDHCGLDRRRKATYLLQFETDGEWKQVGSTCLRDFSGTGFEPEQIAALAEEIIRLFSGGDEEGEWGERSGGEPIWNIEMVLAHASAHIRMDGFTSRAKAKESFSSYATADAVLDRLSMRQPPASEAERKRLAERQPTDADRERAGKVLGWMKGLADQEKLTDYLHNLATIARGGVIEAKQFGLAVSAVSSWQREIGREVERAMAAATSKHFGTVGKRETWTLTVSRVNTKESIYGTTWIIGMVDETGNQAVWFASRNPDVEVGKVYKVKGTVKSHNDYKGVAQTALTRCACEEVEEKKEDVAVAS